MLFKSYAKSLKMFKKIKSSLRNKLILAFISVGFLPSLIFLAYTLLLSETQIVNKSIEDQQEKTTQISTFIHNHIVALNKEVQFLSRLDIMDDLLADDVDKRVSRLITQKSNDYEFENDFIVIDANLNIISASTPSLLATNISLQHKMTSSNAMFIEERKLYIYSKVFASFNKEEQIATLILIYPLTNLNAYLSHKADVHSTIVDAQNNSLFVDMLPFLPSLTKNEGSIINEHLVVRQKMQEPFQEYAIIYAVDKDTALAFLHDFIRFMLYISPLILFIILIVALRYSKQIVKPIDSLTSISEEIISSQDYSKRLVVEGSDEIATLSLSFNKLLATTQTALSALEKENSLRLKRFIQLIEIFNSISQTQEVDECISTSIDAMRELTHNNTIIFKKLTSPTDSGILVEVSDFEKNKKVVMGTVSIDTATLEDENEKKLYYSIVAMLSLQLDRILLIERTMSASRAKSAFISNMSHELRTPLNAIIGFSQYMISYEELNDDQIDTVSNIESSAQYLLSMINEILDIAKIEAGKMEVDIDEVNVLDIVQSAYTMLQPLANEKELTFTFEHQNFIERPYKSDAKIIKQIIVNLLSNAIKFTPEGSVTLRLSTTKTQLIIEVIDSGIGIKDEDLKQLFNDFTQIENVMQKKHKGTGLGLSLSKKLAQMLNGDVHLESEGEGRGTTSIFYINL